MSQRKSIPPKLPVRNSTSVQMLGQAPSQNPDPSTNDPKKSKKKKKAAAAGGDGGDQDTNGGEGNQADVPLDSTPEPMNNNNNNNEDNNNDNEEQNEEENNDEDYDDDAAKDEEQYIVQALGVEYKDGKKPVTGEGGTNTPETRTKDPSGGGGGGDDDDDDNDTRVIYPKNIERAIKRYNVRDITNTKMLSFFVWTTMVGLFYAFTYYNQNADDGFFMVNAFERKFRGHRFTFRYEDIANLEDVFTYLNGPFLSAFTEDDQGLKVSDNNIIVELLFHQNRVKAIECDAVQAVEQFYNNKTGKVSCVSHYKPEMEETKPFGPDNKWTYSEFGEYMRVPMAYSYKPGG